jgi:hypothetical protein
MKFSPWFRDADGRQDSVLTFSFFSVWTILLKTFFAGASIVTPIFKFTVVAPDATVIGAILVPTLGAYVSNKYVKFNYHPFYKKLTGASDPADSQPDADKK